MSTWRILTGDVREQLKTLRSASVQMVCTSPPYFGLRDYNTGTWQGGAENCTHLRVNDTREGVKQVSNEGTVKLQYGKVCGVCGAVRVDPQIGLEDTPGEYVAALVSVFDEIWRVLRDDGTVWLNLGDSYANNRGGHIPPDHLRTGVETEVTTASHRMDLTHVGIKEKDLIGIPWMTAFALRDKGWYLRNDIIWDKPNPMPSSVEDRCTVCHELNPEYVELAKARLGGASPLFSEEIR